MLEQRYHILIELYQCQRERAFLHNLGCEIPRTWSYFYNMSFIERCITHYHLQNLWIPEKVLSEMFFCFYTIHQRKISFVNAWTDFAQLLTDLLKLLITPESLSHFS